MIAELVAEPWLSFMRIGTNELVTARAVSDADRSTARGYSPTPAERELLATTHGEMRHWSGS